MGTSQSTTTDPPETLEDAEREAARIGKENADPDAPPAKPKRVRKPGKTRPRKAPADKAPRTTRAAPLAKRLEDFIGGIGLMVLIVNARDGQLILAGAPKQAAALDALAKENQTVRNALERLLAVSIYGQLAAAFAPTLLGIAANHGAVPPIVGMLVAPPAAPDAQPGAGFGGLDLAGLTEMAAMFTQPAGGDDDGPGVPVGRIVGVG